MRNLLFKGCATALITPFSNGKIDIDSYEKILDFQLKGGADALVVCGTTAETPTLDNGERLILIKKAVKAAKGNVPVIAGTGSNSTEHAIKLSKEAEAAGADAVLSVTPYYNKCTQDGLIKHYEKIASSINIPIIIYNVPSRTGMNIDPETVEKLGSIKNIAGLKDASGNVSQTARTSSLCKEMPIYCGCDDLIIPTLSLGGMGAVSVISNIFPNTVKKMITLFGEGKTKESSLIQLDLIPIIKAVFAEVNPIGIKYAASALGLCTSETRLPLTEASERTKKQINDMIKNMNLE